MFVLPILPPRRPKSYLELLQGLLQIGKNWENWEKLNDPKAASTEPICPASGFL
jgi:hypothetical protein